MNSSASKTLVTAPGRARDMASRRFDVAIITVKHAVGEGLARNWLRPAARPYNKPSPSAREPTVTVEQQRAVFAALVAAQDLGAAVPNSRELVADRFGVTVEQVRAAERAGLDNGWPPLG